jgi:hypothetical protein
MMRKHVPIEPGTKFGKWTVLCKSAKRNNKGTAYYLCECYCGRKKDVIYDSLRGGKSKSCVHCARRTILEIGQRFGRWVIIDNDFTKNRAARYVCKCDCGGQKSIEAHTLIDGTSTGCHRCMHGNGIEYNMTTPQRMYYTRYKQSAKNRGVVFDLTTEQFILLISHKCHYCGAEVSTKNAGGSNPNGTIRIIIANGIDRVDNSIGYIPSNCVPCCKTCNYGKRDMTHAEWMAYIKRLTQHQNRKTKRHTPQSNVYQSQMQIN